jgi:hypothetical protein
MSGKTVTARFDSRIGGMSWGYLCDGHMAELGDTSSAFQLTDEPEPERSESDTRKAIADAIERGDADEVWDLVGDGDLVDFL